MKRTFSRWIATSVLSLSLSFVACSGSPTNDLLQEFNQSDCMSNLPLIPQSPETQPIEITTSGSYINVLYKMANFRCEQKVKFVTEQEGNTIKVTARPVEMNPSVVAACDCKFNLTAKLGPFDDGSYTVKVFHQTDNYGSPSETSEMGSANVTVSNTSTATTGQALLVAGEVQFDGKQSLGKKGKVVIELRDATMQDAAAPLLARQVIKDVTSFPIKFELKGDVAKVFKGRGTYAVAASVFLGNDERTAINDYTSDTIHSVSSSQPTKNAVIKVVQLEDCKAPNSGGFCSTYKRP